MQICHFTRRAPTSAALLFLQVGEGESWNLSLWYQEVSARSNFEKEPQAGRADLTCHSHSDFSKSKSCPS